MHISDKGLDRIILLGIMPLLAGTGSLYTALFMALSCIAAAVIVKLSSDVITLFNNKSINWVLYFTVGTAAASVIYIISVEFYPYIYNQLSTYLLLIGVTPLVYFGCSVDAKWDDFIRMLFSFLIFMITLGFLRELLGQGSILGVSLINTNYAPMVFAASPAGSFIFLGTAWFTVRAVQSYKLLGNIFNMDNERKAEVGGGNAVE